MNNRQERSSSMMKDVISILKSGVEIIWDCIMDTTKQLYWLFKNDNKSHVNTSSEVMGTHDSKRVKSPGIFTDMEEYEDDEEDYEEWGHDQGGSFLRKSLVIREVDESSNDSNQNENEDGVDEDDWRDRFAGWLP